MRSKRLHVATVLISCCCIATIESASTPPVSSSSSAAYPAYSRRPPAYSYHDEEDDNKRGDDDYRSTEYYDRRQRGDDDDDDMERVRPIDYRYRTPRDYDGGDRDGRRDEYYSPKRDLLTQYTSTKVGKAKVKLGSLVLGYIFGVFLSKSIALFRMSHTRACFAVAFLVLTFLRNAHSDFIQSLALLMILVVSKLREIRKRYPTIPHIKSILRPRTCPRRPFPYAGNPWQYDNDNQDDDDAIEFNMMFTVVAMGMAGAMIGGNIPLVPAFIGAPCGGAAFAFGCTLQSAKVRYYIAKTNLKGSSLLFINLNNIF